MWTGSRRRVSGAVWLLALLALPVIPAAASDRVDLTMLAIRATNRNSEISPELRTIASQLKKQFKFSGFRVEQKVGASVQMGRAHRAELPAGYAISAKPVRLEKDRLTLEVEITRKDRRDPLLKSNVTIDAGRFQLFGGSGWKLDGDDILIIAVSGR